MDVGTAVEFYVVYVSGYVHVESIEPTYLREYMRRDSEHARACTVRTAIHLHGVTAHCNTTRPLP